MKFSVQHSVLILCLACSLSSCKQGEKDKTKDFVVKTVKPVKTNGENEKEFTFIAQPFRTSELSFRVGGPIDRFDVYAGNRYKRGSIIAEIDPRDFRIRRERAEAVYQQAKAEFERIQSLYEKNNISASAFEKAKAECTTARMAFETAVNELEDTRLVAPFNGYVGEVYMEKYQDVKAAQPVLSLIDIDQLKIEIYVTQDVAFSIQALDTINLRFDAQPEKLYKARVAEVSKGTTRNNLSYLLTALLPNENGELLAGMSGKAVLDTPGTKKTACVSVPQTALCHRPSTGNFVWVIDSGSNQVSQRKVTLGGILPNGNAQITEGLTAEETVVVSGLRFLSDGMKVSTSENVQG